MKPDDSIPGIEIPAELSDRELQVTVRRLADDLTYGEDPSCYTGSGVDYAQSRVFLTGDSVRDIDWRVTARSGKLHLKEYEAIRRMPMLLLVDTSGSMSVSSTLQTKHRLGAILAGALGLAALRRLSPVGVLGAGERIVRFAPSLSRGRIFQWLTELENEGPTESTNLGIRLDQTGALLKSRSVVVILSDLHDPDGVPAIKRLSHRHDCIVIQLMDPAEEGRLRGGFFRGREAETRKTFTAHGLSRFFGKKGPSRGPELIQSGIDHILLRTDEPFILPLRRFLKERGAFSRGTR